jgi:hypothetical protein
MRGIRGGGVERMTRLEATQRALPTPPALSIPERFAALTPADLPEVLQRTVLQYLQDFPHAFEQGLAPAFLGRARTFKTAATYVLLELIRVQYRVRVDILCCPEDLLRFEFDRFQANHQQFVYHLTTVPVLAIDDFATLDPDGFVVKSILGTIISARHKALRPTIWNGNLHLAAGREADTLGQQYGVHFTRRLLDGARGYLVYLT